jgi:peptidoglycan-N-acetylglucosamine deacetylase
MTRIRPLACLLLLCAAPVAADERRPVLITVDDLPVASGRLHPDPADRARITRDLLSVLARHHVPAVGFVIWGNVQTAADQQLLDLWLHAGHELGNHSFSHPDYTTTTTAAYVADVEKGRVGLDRFLEARGRAARFFRYPYLDEGDTTAKLRDFRAYLARGGQRSLPVTVDDQDWSFEAPWVEARGAGDGEALERLKADYLAMLRAELRRSEDLGDRLFGRRVPSVVLLHANEIGGVGWDEFFTWLEATGHRFADADEVLADPVFAEPPDYAGRHGFGLWDRIAALREEERVGGAIRSLVGTQVDAWNRGDLAAFCATYAEDASFATPSGLTQGRGAVLERYRTRYPDAAARGRLSIDILEMRFASGTEVSIYGDALPSRVHGVSVLGRWRIEYPDKPVASGLTLLVFRHTGDGWEIVEDASM